LAAKSINFLRKHKNYSVAPSHSISILGRFYTIPAFFSVFSCKIVNMLTYYRKYLIQSLFIFNTRFGCSAG